MSTTHQGRKIRLDADGAHGTHKLNYKDAAEYLLHLPHQFNYLRVAGDKRFYVLQKQPVLLSIIGFDLVQFQGLCLFVQTPEESSNVKGTTQEQCIHRENGIYVRVGAHHNVQVDTGMDDGCLKGEGDPEEDKHTLIKFCSSLQIIALLTPSCRESST